MNNNSRSNVSRNGLGVCTLAALAGAVVMGMTASAHGAFIQIVSDSASSTENLGAFTGSVDYAFDEIAGIGTLTISLTNTSDPDNGGYITGFVFNIDAANVVADLISGTHAFLNAPNQNAMPFGNPFTAGAALGANPQAQSGNFQGGGNPTRGIAVGDTGTFTFAVTGAAASTLTPMSFVSGSYAHNFIVRFRGFNDDGSDKTPAIPVSIPAPATTLLPLLGLAGLSGGRRRRG